MVGRLIHILFFLLVTCELKAQVNKPSVHFNFEKPDFKTSSDGNYSLRSAGGTCLIEPVKGIIGNAIRLEGRNCLVSSNILNAATGDAFALAFYFKGKRFEFISYPKQHFAVSFDYPYFSFTISTQQQGKIVREFYKSELTGSGAHSYDHYDDDNWHAVVFNYSSALGRREIWADGVLVNESTATIAKGKKVLFEPFDGFKNSIQLDELKLYNRYLDSGTISQLAGHTQLKRSERSLDTMQFAPGFPAYSVSLLNQLKQFPAPRYASGMMLPRNVSWMDINYLSEGVAAAAVAIETEMYKHWNYRLDIPLLRAGAAKAARIYTDTTTVTGAVLNLARQQPSWEYSVISMQAQIQPQHAGFQSEKPFISSQQLPDKNYLRGKDGKPILANGRKLLSPLMDPKFMQQDAQTIRFYLAQLLQQLKRPPSLVTENGEVFGNAYRENLLRQDPLVWNDFQKSGLTRTDYFGKFQYRMEEQFRSILLKDLPATTIFSIFQLSAVQPDFWGAYRFRRKVNRMPDGSIRSTPDFYPYTPGNWQLANGPYNGYGMIARGRATEISLGDRDFSPFVAAGWLDEKENIRPAQWLALLKSMVMLGADFFYVGYFNITGAGGKWLNGIGPNDPKGYAYQVAIPAYAQAIRSQVPEFFQRGSLLNAAGHFRFTGSAINDLILVRKLNDKWLIYGSIQPTSNLAGNVPDHRITTIELERKKISFPISRQGNMYVLQSIETANPVFYQLDAWHELTHPYFWSSNLNVEAENCKLEEGIAAIETRASGKLNFSGFTSFRRLLPGAHLSYFFDGMEQQQFSRLELILHEKGSQRVEMEWRVGKDKGNWKGIPDKIVSIPLNGSGKLELKLKSGTLNLDKIVLKP